MTAWNSEIKKLAKNVKLEETEVIVDIHDGCLIVFCRERNKYTAVLPWTSPAPARWGSGDPSWVKSLKAAREYAESLKADGESEIQDAILEKRHTGKVYLVGIRAEGKRLLAYSLSGTSSGALSHDLFEELNLPKDVNELSAYVHLLKPGTSREKVRKVLSARNRAIDEERDTRRAVHELYEGRGFVRPEELRGQLKARKAEQVADRMKPKKAAIGRAAKKKRSKR